MAKATTPITRALNKQFKTALPEGLRIQANIFGSFASIRVEDPQGVLSVKMAREISIAAGHLFVEAGMVEDIRPVSGITFHMDGVVMNWNVKN